MTNKTYSSLENVDGFLETSHEEDKGQDETNGAATVNNDGDSDDEKKESMFTRKKTIILFSISLYWFIVGCAFAMIAPFFPGEVGTPLVVYRYNGLPG